MMSKINKEQAAAALAAVTEPNMTKKQKRGKTYKSRAWAGILYPDSAPVDWLERIKGLHMMAFVSPLHDKDTTADGTPKKPHYHILLVWEGPTSMSIAQKVLSFVGCIEFVARIQSVTGYARYLCHIDDHDKHRYSEKDVQAFGGADYELAINRSVDKDDVINQMCEFVDTHHIYSFRSFARYCRRNEPSWNRHLSTDSGWYMKEYIKSAYWEECTPEGADAVRKQQIADKRDLPFSEEIDTTTGEVK